METTATDLSCLLDAGEGAVVTLVAGDTRLVAHRAVLVDRSPIFDAMFRHDMLEASSGQVNIADMEGPALRQLLAFLYTLQAPKLSDMAQQLLVAADKYGVSVLKATCERQVAAQLSVETAAAAVFLAVRHSCPRLRQAAIAYIKDHQVEVMATRGWADAVRMQPEDVDEVRQLLSETSSATHADSGTFRTQPLGRTVGTATTAGSPPLPRRLLLPPYSRSHMMSPKALAWQLSTRKAIQHGKETTVVDLGALLDACDDAVVTLVAGGTRLVAHRAVLMDRSPVFTAMFSHDTLESRSGQVTIEDVEGPVLRQMLAYLYTLRAPQLPDMAAQLLAAANKYGVAGLKAACEQQLVAELSAETAAATAVLAVRHSCTILKQVSITFLKAFTQQVMVTRGWADATRSQPDYLMEVYRLLVAEFRRLPGLEKGRRLNEAAMQGGVEELEVLLAAGVVLATPDGSEERVTALHRAAGMGYVEVVRWLVARGAPVDARTCWEETPLHYAALNGHAAVVRSLLVASADHSIRSRNDGWTPLHSAVLSGKAEVVAALLERGADREARCNRGQTPLDLAVRYKHQQLVDLLREN